MAAAASTTEVGLAWLLRMRWGAACTLSLAVLGGRYALGIPLKAPALLALVAVMALTNAAFAVPLRRGEAVPSWVPAGLLALDVATATAMLYLAGGPSNPFSALYLVYVTLAAVLLGERTTWPLVAFACACYGGLFVRSVAVPAMGDHGAHHAHGGGGGFEGHLYGMFVAFAVTASLITYFVSRLSAALRARDAELRAARERTARAEHVASLTTLAAGAAHELGSPLSTIAVIAKELERALAARPELAELAEDATAVRDEVGRCRAILDRMAVRAGETVGEAPETLSASELVRELTVALGPSRAAALDLACDDVAFSAPPRALLQALENLVRNAFDAHPGGRVHLRAAGEGERVVFEVRDQGPGMDEATLARATEPFFTTKEAGRGMGLGLFLVDSLVTRLGGTFRLASRTGEGTTATIVLPREREER